MNESGYYPTGAGNDPRAPWNGTDNLPVGREIRYSCNMHRDATVETTDYAQGTWERDGRDFSDTDWLGGFKSQHRTPGRLVSTLRDIATAFANGHVPEMSVSEWRDIAEDCGGWEIEDEDAEIL